MGRAIFIDLDGTLMQRDLSISSVNKEALQHAIQRGFQVVLVSGRPINFVDFLAKEIDGKIQTIGFNGAYSKELLEYPINEKMIMDLYELFKDNQVRVMFKTLDHIYAKDDVFMNFVYPISKDEKVGYSEGSSLEDILNKKVFKVIGLYNGNEIEINDLLKDYDMTKVFYEGKGFELTHKNANKGNAIKLYCLKNNISITDSYMFGDDVNDITMFSLGGKNMVMGNANEEVKKYAHKICERCEDDGVGKMIELILKEKIYD